MTDPAPMRFLARPFICGVIGRADPVLIDRLRASRPDLVTIHAADDVLLLASRDLPAYRNRVADTAWGFGDRAPPADCDWQAAALAVEASGLAVRPDRVTLHAGAHGYLDVFHRRLDEATWFANRLELLLDLDDAPLDVDWESWACTLMLVVPIADRTPFRAIGRLEGATALVLDRTTGRTCTERWSPPWIGLPAAAPGDGDPGVVFEAVRAALSRYGDRPTSLPLSGGYDSRLIGIGLHQAGVPTVAWTGSKDDGRHDAAIATEVATLLGFRHTLIDGPTDRYAELADEVQARFGYRGAQHVWAGEMARAIRAEGLRVADGNALDIRLYATHIPWAAVDAPDRDVRDAAMFADLSRKRPARDSLTPTAMAWATDAAWRTWRAAFGHLRDDPNEEILAVLAVRSTMGPGIMAQNLYGPELAVVLPGIDAEVVRAALTVDLRRKIDGDFYRELLRHADPVVGSLRSTRDPIEHTRGGPRRKTSVESRQWLAARIDVVAGLVPGMIEPGLATMLRSAGNLAVADSARPERSSEERLRRLRSTTERSLGIATFGGWLERHADRLGALDPPWTTRQTTVGRWSFPHRLRRRADVVAGYLWRSRTGDDPPT